MKKLLLSVVFSVLYVTSASADMGVNVGVTGNAGIFAASANESFSDNSTTSTNQNGSEHGSAGWASIMVEATVNDRLMIGIDYVPQSLETDTTESARTDKTAVGDDAGTIVTNKIQIDLEDLTTVYVGAMLTENFFVKAGMMTVDVITNESLGTGGSYGNTELDGTMFGMGYHVANDSGAFFRFEGNYLQFDAQTVTNSNDTDKSIKLKNLDGVSGRITVGKSF